jgi:hypothetical protein
MGNTRRLAPSTRSAIMILIDVLVIFALTARWGEAQAAM